VHDRTTVRLVEHQAQRGHELLAVVWGASRWVRQQERATAAPQRRASEHTVSALKKQLSSRMKGLHS
jgi:hypothetical protein